MFGLMRAKKCGMTAAEKNFRRLNYCGTCKAIGSLYGQKARLLLNHDTVFLAEMLAALGGERAENWPRAVQSYNCLSLPDGESVPFALRYAATANVVLTAFKLDDHAEDEGKSRYKIARRAFSDEFRRAAALLREWDFPLGKVKSVLASQREREFQAAGDAPAAAVLERVAAPTAEATALFFGEGVRRARGDEAADEAYRLGYAFGRLVYLVDGFEDYEKDFRDGQFNAFRAAYRLKEKSLSPVAKRRIAAALREIESEIAAIIRRLPLDENRKTLFVGRLAENLQRKLRAALPVLPSKRSCAPRPKKSFADRWREARSTAASLARSYSWQMPAVFLFVFVFALAAPAQSREARSARECLDLSFNLMTFGAVFGAVLSLPVMAMQNLTPGQIAEKAEKKRREGWCDNCNCNSCDCSCCDCCGYCGDGCGDGCCCDGCCCDCSCDC